MEYTIHGLPVDITVRRNARRFIARRRADRIILTVPAGACEADIDEALRRLAPKLKDVCSREKRLLFSDGQVIEQPGIRIEVHVSNEARGGIGLRGTTASAELLIDPQLDLADISVQRIVSQMMLRVARNRARSIIIPMAAATAESLALRPAAWHIGRGVRTLGTCSARGDITLSAALMFVPEHLRRFVICHELAHLTEHNHSPRFHALCNKYCQGHERALQAELRAYPFPLLR